MGVKGSGRKPLSTEWFIGRVNEVHGQGKFGFDKCEYSGNRNCVTLFCYECNEYFYSRAAGILKGSGCNLCRRKRTALKKTLTTEQFIERAISVHGETYSYLDTVYERTSKKVAIRCGKHGIFKQIASNHLQGYGCPKCNHWDILAKYRPNEPAMLYHVKFKDRRNGSVFHKIGITIKDWKYRLHGCKSMGYELELVESFNGKCIDCHKKELEILSYLDITNRRYKCHALKDTRVGGWTETFFPDNEVLYFISCIINK